MSRRFTKTGICAINKEERGGADADGVQRKRQLEREETVEWE